MEWSAVFARRHTAAEVVRGGGVSVAVSILCTMQRNAHAMGGEEEFPPYAMMVKDVRKLRQYLESGGNPNSTPFFMDRTNHVVWAVCCAGRYYRGDYGQSVGPWDALDWDERMCGTDEPGSASYCGGHRTLLHWAVVFDEEPSVRLLLEYGANKGQSQSQSHTTKFPLPPRPPLPPLPPQPRRLVVWC